MAVNDDRPKSWSFDLPDKLKIAIADCITVHNKIESCIVETVWVAEQANLERKKEIARGWGKQNVRIVRRIVESIPGAQSDEIWPGLTDLGKERNIVGHGVGMIT